MANVKKRKLDQETLLKLAGLLPCNNDFTIDFTPEMYDNVDPEFRPVFTIKPFNNKQVKEIAAYYSSNDQDEEYMINKVKDQLVGWKNFINISTGEPIPFDKDISIIPQRCLISIISELLRISGVTA